MRISNPVVWDRGVGPVRRPDGPYYRPSAKAFVGDAGFLSVIKKTHGEVSGEDVLQCTGTIAEESRLASLTL